MGMDARDSTGTAGQMPVVVRLHDHGKASRLKTVLRISALSLLVLATLFAGGFGWFANKVSHLTTPANPAKADAIIVLTGGQSRLDAAMDLLVSERQRISTLYFMIDEENIKLQLQQPWVMIGTDAGGLDPAWAAPLGPYHPRAYGFYARNVGK